MNPSQTPFNPDKHYVGTACKHGHVDENNQSIRYLTTGTCVECANYRYTKTPEAMSKQSIHSRNWQKKNKEAFAIITLRFREKHRERALANNMIRYHANKLKTTPEQHALSLLRRRHHKRRKVELALRTRLETETLTAKQLDAITRRLSKTQAQLQLEEAELTQYVD